MLRDHQPLIDLWNEVLPMPGWPLNDGAVDYYPKTSLGTVTIVMGKRGASDDE